MTSRGWTSPEASRTPTTRSSLTDLDRRQLARHDRDVAGREPGQLLFGGLGRGVPEQHHVLAPLAPHQCLRRRAGSGAQDGEGAVAGAGGAR